MMRPVYRKAASPWAPPSPAVPSPAWSPMPEAMGEVDTDRTFLSVVAVLFAGLVFFRFALTDPVMNLVLNYSGEGGTLVEKIHPCTQAVILLFLLTLAKVRITLTASEAGLIRQMGILIGVIFALVAFVQVSGHSIALGYLLETYIGACIYGFLLLALPNDKRRMIGETVLIYIILCSFLAVFEKATSIRLLPYPYNEISFRPTALTSHPLAIGLNNAGATVFILATRWKGWVKTAAILTVVMGTFASGARTGMIFTVLSVLAALAITRIPAAGADERLRIRLIAAGSILIGGAILIALAGAAGFLERFEGGYIDENAQARVDVYKVFDWVSWKDILLGADLIVIKKMVFERLNLLIESSIVIFVFQFGLFGALAFGGAILWTFFRLAAAADWRALIGAGAWFGTAMSNDTLSGKHAHITMMVLLFLAFRTNAHDHLGQRVRPGWEANR